MANMRWKVSWSRGTLIGDVEAALSESFIAFAGAKVTTKNGKKR
jgi:hypothetical protein